MRTRSVLPVAALLCATVPCFGITHHHTTTTNASIKHSAKSKRTHATLKQGMDSDRATQIQQALIKNGYMSGEPSGVWDAQSTAAMQRFQGDNGWQTKIAPDSRALIKLGLGPQQDAVASAAIVPQP